jgi:hypothetical protein
MRKLIEMPYDDKSTVLVAVDIPEDVIQTRPDDGITNTSAKSSFAYIKSRIDDYLKGDTIKTAEKFSSISDLIVKYSKPIIRSFQTLREEDAHIKKASAEFSLSFSGKGTVYLVESTVAGAIKVNIEWDLDKIPKAN